ncbi:MAG: DUF898 domain-containing protein [Campylobacteraceae bacterium]|jgi:uncharacterized membrane protein YjgN (DUF898 family)|nr:DUF898 domain-containing protein [Campylobacteraceae bacterium]
METESPNNSQILENEPLSFRGNGFDFFKIWFVNIVLTIITLGIYGPWAKVRNNQYIYGNTYLGNHSFEYTANPIKILFGRLIVLAFYAAYFIASSMMFFEVAGIIALVFMLLLPFLIRQALLFRTKYTRFHGLNFRFKASVGAFYSFFLLHTLLNFITIGIIFPYTHSEFKKLVLNNTSYGDSDFYFPGKPAQFFFVYYVKMLLLYTAFFVIFMILAVIFIPFSKMAYTAGPIIMVMIIYPLLIIFTFVVQGSLHAWIARVVYNNTYLKEYRMLNEWSASRLSWIYLSNFIVIIFSFGLLYPWTKIRTIRYKLENMGFEKIDLNVFIGQSQKDVSAVGEETSDFFDFDIGF